MPNYFDMNKEIETKLQLFGMRIRDLRKKLGLSQEKFALKIGIDRTYLASVEKGKRNISFENIVRIAAGLGVSASYLLEGI